jgi:hypothetical protein
MNVMKLLRLPDGSPSPFPLPSRERGIRKALSEGWLATTTRVKWYFDEIL